MIEINGLKSVIKTTNATIDYLVEKLILATARLEKQNEPCPYCGNRRYFDTCIASIEPEYYATCETCRVNFFFTREELKEMEKVKME